MTVLEHDWFPRPLPAGAEVGARSWLYSSYAFHHCHGSVRIGPDSGVYHGTHFEIGPDGEVLIGRFCTIVGAIIATNARVTIGDRTFIAHEVVLADDAFAVPPGLRGQSPHSGAGIAIGENAWIGARAIVLGGSTIGDDAVVGAGAVVSGDVPAGATVVGNPARVV
jgi:acetyltransferase-like isoleucine patch superfamily enzyme